MNNDIFQTTLSNLTSKYSNNFNDNESTNTNELNFEQLFDLFIQSNSSKSIKKSFENILKYLDIDQQQVFEHGYDLNTSYSTKYHNNRNVINRYANRQNSSSLFDPNNHQKTRLIYKIIKSKTDYWKANELWKKYDKKANLKEYARNLATSKDLNVIIIGCGPVGLRLSIECALLGLKCVIIEKRDRFSRNNVLHLWPYTIHDLKTLGAKLFYGKFCAGSIDHISIRKLQCVLLKCALLMGVQIYFNTSFEEIVEPCQSDEGWRVRLIPENHPLAHRSFDVVIGADGRRNSLPGFNRKEFRGRLAIGITANFINYNTAEEAEVQERSGVAFIFDQKFFLDLRDETKIDLENIVYYKDDTHYFVMTAKRSSLLEKGVIKQDFTDANQLLGKENVNFDKLCDYAKEAAYASTNKKLNRLDFAKNHYGQPDVAMFDFTSLFHSENASRIVERNGKKLLMSLVGDSLLEPFWPLGTGIARGFLAALDTAWQIKGFSNDRNPIELLYERENIYQLLSQTTHDNISKNYQEFTIDPTTRYINLKINLKKVAKINDNTIKQLYDNGNKPLNSIENSYLNMENNNFNNNSSSQLHNGNYGLKFNKRTKIENNSRTLLHWAQMVVQPYNIKLENFTNSWKDGLAFAAIIHRFKQDLIDYNSLSQNSTEENLKNVFNVMITNLNMTNLSFESDLDEFYKANVEPSKSNVLSILDKLYNIFKNDEFLDIDFEFENNFDPPADFINPTSTYKRKINNTQDDNILLKRNLNCGTTNSISNEPITKPMNRRNSLKTNLFRNKIEFFNNNDLNSNPLPTNGCLSTPFNFVNNRPKSEIASSGISNSYNNNNNLDLFKNQIAHNTSICYKCDSKVYLMERQNVLEDLVLHVNCFRCEYCDRLLRSGGFTHKRDPITLKYSFYCTNHANIISPTDNSKTLDYEESSLLLKRRKINEFKKFFDIDENDDFNNFENKLNKKLDENLEDQNSKSNNIHDEDQDEFQNFSIIQKENLLKRSNFYSSIGNNFGSYSNKNSNNSNKSINNPNLNLNNSSASLKERAEFESAYEEDLNVDEDENDENEDENDKSIDLKDNLFFDDEDYDYDDNEDEEEEEEEEDEDDEEEDQNENENNCETNYKYNDSNDHEKTISNDILANHESNENNELEIEKRPDSLKQVDDKNITCRKEKVFKTVYDLYKTDFSFNSNYKTRSLSLDEEENDQLNFLSPTQISSETPKKTKLKKFNINSFPLINNNNNNTNNNNNNINNNDIKNDNFVESSKQTYKNNVSYEYDDLDEPDETNNFYCNVCKKPAKIDERIRLKGDLIYHKDCCKCLICNAVVKYNNQDNFKRVINSSQIYFYCIQHAPENSIKDKYLIKSIEVDPDQQDKKTNDYLIINKKFDYLNEINYDYPKYDKFITQRKASESKNDEIKMNESNEETSSSSSSNEYQNSKSQSPLSKNGNESITTTSTTTTTTRSSSNSLQMSQLTPEQRVQQIIEREQNGILDLYLIRQQAQEKARLKSDEELGININENVIKLIRTQKEENVLKKLNENQNIRKNSFDSKKSVDEDADEDLESFSLTENEDLSEIDQPVKNDYSPSAPLAKSETFENLDLDDLNSDTGETNYKTRNNSTRKKQIKTNKSQKSQNAKKKRIIPNIKFDPSTSYSSSCETEDREDSLDSLAGSFNALNVTNSPRLSKNSRMAKLNLKRQQNEEKKLEKQKQDKRLRMSQEIQRKQDEIETRLDELEKDGVQLEKAICSINSKDLENLKHKEKLEQELYNLIHQKNVLTRIENELNIQSRALAIEDKLSECQFKLRETINTPESDKTIEMMEREKLIMEKIVELVEQKNQLVEQLESLRIIEKEEDTMVTKIFSGKLIRLNNSKDLIDKFKPYNDII